MKRAFVLLWKGLTGIIAATAEWFTVILGMKDDSKYGRFIRRVVGGSFATLMLLLAGAALYECIGSLCYKYKVYNAYAADYDGQYLSRNATYYSQEFQNDGYVETRDGKKTIMGIHWIAKPLGEDSLVCYSDGDARGYFNMLTGEMAIKPKYKHAWVFSDGLASVDDNGMIKFIDAKGDIVIDLNIPYITGAEGYVFHNGYCVIHSNKSDKYGMIDRKGKWVLDAEYDAITATMKDHTLRKYSLKGELLDDFLISNVIGLLYDTDEIRYTTAQNYDDEGNFTGETADAEPTPYQKTASCKKYEAESDWFGLMSPGGKILQPSVMICISARLML